MKNNTSTVNQYWFLIKDGLGNLLSSPNSDFDNRKQIVSLDALRGIAAIAVIFWHYQHFFYSDGFADETNVAVSSLPLHFIFFPFYDYGYLAVQLFWIMSGFVFAYVYPPHLQISSRSFTMNRFARLYPLHILTLVIVAVTQYFLFFKFGQFALYQNNDIYHFILNIGLISAWGFQQGASFNEPIWSVSVEILAYVCFWFSRKWIFKHGFLFPAILAFVTIFLSLKVPGMKFIFQCICCFFIGTVICLFYTKYKEWGVLPALVSIILIFIPIIILISPIKLDTQFTIFSFAPALVVAIIYLNDYFLILIPRLSQWLGQISYGIYLWQIPVQLIFMLLVFFKIITPAIFSNLWMLLLFISIILVISHFSYFYFEKPMRNLFRQPR